MLLYSRFKFVKIERNGSILITAFTTYSTKVSISCTDISIVPLTQTAKNLPKEVKAVRVCLHHSLSLVDHVALACAHQQYGHQ